jgi:hypothetical protein
MTNQVILEDPMTILKDEVDRITRDETEQEREVGIHVSLTV